ncbi:isochorismatase family protein [Streptomyces sp. NPDC046805]|uniref:cysteine hydrolase family protein n=1 Tax=Streptomyces sp. NPDC046805 TaxID=3155134 RepID=UPI0033E08E74
MAAVPGSEEALKRAHAALSWARSHDVQVAYVRAAFSAEDFAAVPSRNIGFAPIAANGFLADGSPEAGLHDSFEVREQDITVRKRRIRASVSATDLRVLLRERGIHTLVLAGLSTGGVVPTSLR